MFNYFQTLFKVPGMHHYKTDTKNHKTTYLSSISLTQLSFQLHIRIIPGLYKVIMH